MLDVRSENYLRLYFYISHAVESSYYFVVAQYIVLISIFHIIRITNMLTIK